MKVGLRCEAQAMVTAEPTCYGTRTHHVSPQLPVPVPVFVPVPLYAAANKALASLPESITLDDCALVDFEFLEAPTTTSQYLLTSHKVCVARLLG